MVERTGGTECAVFDNAGYANPVQFTTSEIGVSGEGEGSPVIGGCHHGTVSTLTQPEIYHR